MRLFERLVYAQEMEEALKPFTMGMINLRTKRDVTLLWPYYPMKCLEAHFDRVLLFDFSKAFDTVSHRIVNDTWINPHIID